MTPSAAAFKIGPPREVPVLRAVILILSTVLTTSLGHALSVQDPGEYLQPAPICGLFQSDDFTGQTAYSLIDFSTYPPQATTYSIQNPNDNVVISMVLGHCYCVTGATQPDPQFAGDPMFKIISITRADSGTGLDCTPRSNGRN